MNSSIVVYFTNDKDEKIMNIHKFISLFISVLLVKIKATIFTLFSILIIIIIHDYI